MSDTPIPPAALALIEHSVMEFKRALMSAYQTGFWGGVEAGRSSMRDAILKAAQEPIEAASIGERTVTNAPTQLSVVRTPHHGSRDRAPRGSVRESILAALTAHPAGLTEKELAAEMERIDPTVSGRSAGGELRRLKDRLYRQEGGKWFLTKERLRQTEMPVVTERAEPKSPALSQPQTTQEETDASETTIAA